MADGPIPAVMRRLRRLAGSDADGRTGDAALLARFARSRDAEAFELLVWRHAGLVWGACRRVLRNAADAEDAFQATFLVLARKAGSVRRTAALAGWLHQVALRAALRAREREAKHNAAPLSEVAEARESVAERAETAETLRILDEEIDRLPAKLRAAVVLCHLQGQSVGDAAALLGCPRGTVLSRLAAAREKLRGRLVRRGLAPFVALSALAADPSSVLVASTVRLALAPVGSVLAPAAAVISQGILRSMLMTKVKIGAAVVLAVGLGGGGTGWMTAQPQAVAQVAEKQGAAKQQFERAELEAKLKEAEAQAVKWRTMADQMKTQADTLAAQLAATRDQAEALKRHLAEQQVVAQQARKQAQESLYRAELSQAQALQQEKAARDQAVAAEKAAADRARAGQQLASSQAEMEKKARLEQRALLEDRYSTLMRQFDRFVRENAQQTAELRVQLAALQDTVAGLEGNPGTRDALNKARQDYFRAQAEMQSREELSQLTRKRMLAEIDALGTRARQMEFGGGPAAEQAPGLTGLEHRLEMIERELGELRRALAAPKKP